MRSIISLFSVWLLVALSAHALHTGREGGHQQVVRRGSSPDKMLEARKVSLAGDLAIPNGTPSNNGPSRPVYVVSRMVGGAAVSWIVDGVLKYFSPAASGIINGGSSNRLYHWAILVGDYYHQLQATSLDGGEIFYSNRKVSVWDNWNYLPVGVTNMNDQALEQAGIKALDKMNSKYHWQKNNCQDFVYNVMDIVLPGARKPPKDLGKRNLQYLNSTGDAELDALLQWAMLAKQQELKDEGIAVTVYE